MKTPKVLYVLVGIFCIFAIIAGIYAQFIENKESNHQNSGSGNNAVSNKNDSEAVKEELYSLFTNKINLNGFDSSKISKINQEKEIVYPAFQIVENNDAYEININIPVVNIKTEVGNSFNAITQSIFANKANEVKKKTDTTSKTIYSIDYVGYINNNILSLVIRSTLKEAENAQRVIIQTYNYNLETDKKVTLSDVILAKSLDKTTVERKIKEVVTEADTQSKTIQSMGYSNIFSRDLTSEIYTVENSGTFFLGENEKLYIIYAYGNQNFTSAMDIILFE